MFLFSRTIVGVVTGVFIDTPFARGTDTRLLRMQFFLDNEEGSDVHCKAWQEQAELFRDKIKDNQVSLFNLLNSRKY